MIAQGISVAAKLSSQEDGISQLAEHFQEAYLTTRSDAQRRQDYHQQS